MSAFTRKKKVAIAAAALIVGGAVGVGAAFTSQTSIEDNVFGTNLFDDAGTNPSPEDQVKVDGDPFFLSITAEDWDQPQSETYTIDLGKGYEADVKMAAVLPEDGEPEDQINPELIMDALGAKVTVGQDEVWTGSLSELNLGDTELHVKGGEPQTITVEISVANIEEFKEALGEDSNAVVDFQFDSSYV